MRRRWRTLVLVAAAGVACVDGPPAEPYDGFGTAVAPATFDGADFATETEMVDHGGRLASILGCGSCHLPDYSGANFGAMIPLLDGLWATNISRTLPTFSDDELERLLRDGVHPTREIYLMPSKQSQWLGQRDMDALIAYLRSIPPTGEPTPPPPPGFEEAVTDRLPADYWRTSPDGAPMTYHNSEEEADYFAENAPPAFGYEFGQGRLVALTVCTSCHGAALDGAGELAGDVRPVLDYDPDEARTLLREGRMAGGRLVAATWVTDDGGTDHVFPFLTDGEVDAVIAYVRRLAEERHGADR